jgi:hypothetical protein
VHSFNHSFIQFIHFFISFISSFIYSLDVSFVHPSFNQSFIHQSFMCSFCAFILSFPPPIFSAESFAPEHSWICGFVIISGVLPIHPSPVRSCTSQMLQRGAHAQAFPVGHWIYGFQHGLAAPS